MKTALLIMAAGIGSRYGAGIKQLAAVDGEGHIIMDYSVHDAIAAGFNKIVFIIRKDIEADFRTVIGDRIEAVCRENGVECAYAFQSLSDIPGALPEGRTKPWGTGQAVLAAKEHLDCPFAVINADDYYGKQAYAALHEWLVRSHAASAICMAGFILKNTLSDNGGVTRGVCRIDAGHSHVTDVVETKHIVKTPDGPEADGVRLDPEAYVSMNMWGFPAGEGEKPPFLGVLEEGFRSFFEEEVTKDAQKSEYLLPTLIGSLLRSGKAAVRLLPTEDSWFGVTYAEDRASVAESFAELIEKGEYTKALFDDLQN